MLGSDAVPLVQLGGLNLGKWQPVTTIKQPYIYSWVMNNYWFTNFRATQQGEFKWSYYLTSTADTSNTEATRFGHGSRTPLVPRVLPAGHADAFAPVLSTLDLGVSNLVLVEARPAYHGQGMVLHLREVDGKPASLPVAKLTAIPAVQSVQEVNVLEGVVGGEPATLDFAPYESKFVKLTLNQ